VGGDDVIGVWWWDETYSAQEMFLKVELSG